MRAYGVKNPAQIKEEKKYTSQPSSPNRKYYPIDRAGNYDEWAAIQASQYATATTLQNQHDKNKRAFME